MKKIFLIIASCAVMFSSCVSLEETVYDFTSPSTAYDEIASFESIILGCYSQNRSVHSSNLWATAGDKTFQDNLNFTRFAVTANNSTVYGIWSGYYSLVNYTNEVISNIDQATDATEDQIDEVLGQAYFFRALSYFYLVRYFGDVPLITEPITTASGALEYSRDSSTDVYAQIISDFEQAESMLPTSWSETGRVTKYAAMTALAEVYLTMAGAPLKQTAYYATAAAKAKEIIQTGAFSLGDSYQSLFIPNSQASHPAIIFDIEYIGTEDSSFSAPWYSSVSLLEGLTNPGMRVGGYFMETFPDGPRKEATFYQNTSDGVVYYLSTASDDVISLNADRKYFLKDATEQYGFTNKYCHVGDGENIYSASKSDQNTLIYRYADVLLIYAEAIARSSSADALAYECLNSVRERAYYAEDYTELSGLSNDEFIETVMSERRYEFAFECRNWWDIVRLEEDLEYEVYSAGSIEPTIYSASNPDRYLMPIPYEEIELNPNLTQNTGY